MKKLDAENLDQHKASRLEHKSMMIYDLSKASNGRYLENTRYTNPIKRKFRMKRMAAESTFFINFDDTRLNI